MGVNVLFLQRASMHASVGAERGDPGLDVGFKFISGAHFVFFKCQY
jgi:hypothetical protein